MGQCYSVRCKIKKFESEEGAIRALQEHIKNDKRTDYGLGYYAAQGVMTDNFDDLMRIFLADYPGQKVVIEKKKGVMGYSNNFDASYGWESVLGEMFQTMAPYIGEGSELVVYPDSSYDKCVVRDGKVVQIHKQKEEKMKIELYILQEEFENGDGIREFSILGISFDRDGLIKQMKELIEKDEYGLISDNGVFEEREDFLQTNYVTDVGFVEYSVSRYEADIKEDIQELCHAEEQKKLDKQSCLNYVRFYCDTLHDDESMGEEEIVNSAFGTDFLVRMAAQYRLLLETTGNAEMSMDDAFEKCMAFADEKTSVLYGYLAIIKFHNEDFKIYMECHENENAIQSIEYYGYLAEDITKRNFGGSYPKEKETSSYDVLLNVINDQFPDELENVEIVSLTRRLTA